METTIPPANVSPLIKGARWGLLFLGVIYGSARYSTLYKMNQRKLAEYEKNRPMREAKEKAEKERLERETMEDLNKNLGIQL